MKKLTILLILLAITVSVKSQVVLADTTINGINYAFEWDGKILFSPRDSCATVWGKMHVVVLASNDTILSTSAQAVVKSTALQTQFNYVYTNANIRNKFSREIRRKMNKAIFKPQNN